MEPGAGGGEGGRNGTVSVWDKELLETDGGDAAQPALNSPAYGKVGALASQRHLRL